MTTITPMTTIAMMTSGQVLWTIAIHPPYESSLTAITLITKEATDNSRANDLSTFCK
jgi:hypothetical protein